MARPRVDGDFVEPLVDAPLRFVALSFCTWKPAALSCSRYCVCVRMVAWLGLRRLSMAFCVALDRAP
ncbi:MAG: hypothetical protein R2873_13375 [Caldilineaceae bacterium]